MSVSNSATKWVQCFSMKLFSIEKVHLDDLDVYLDMLETQIFL